MKVHSKLLTEAENEALDLSVKLWNAIVRLPVMNNDELSEYRKCIHDIQGRIMSRPVRSEINKEE